MKRAKLHPAVRQWALVLASIVASSFVLTLVKRLLGTDFPIDITVGIIAFAVWYRTGGKDAILRAKRRSLEK